MKDGREATAFPPVYVDQSHHAARGRKRIASLCKKSHIIVASLAVEEDDSNPLFPFLPLPEKRCLPVAKLFQRYGPGERQSCTRYCLPDLQHSGDRCDSSTDHFHPGSIPGRALGMCGLLLWLLAWPGGWLCPELSDGGVEKAFTFTFIFALFSSVVTHRHRRPQSHLPRGRHGEKNGRISLRPRGGGGRRTHPTIFPSRNKSSKVRHLQRAALRCTHTHTHTKPSSPKPRLSDTTGHHSTWI